MLSTRGKFRREGFAMLNPFHDREDDIRLSTLCRRVGTHLSWGHRQRGKLEMYRLGGHWRVSRDAWERFLLLCNPELADRDGESHAPTRPLAALGRRAGTSASQSMGA